MQWPYQRTVSAVTVASFFLILLQPCRLLVQTFCSHTCRRPPARWSALERRQQRRRRQQQQHHHQHQQCHLQLHSLPSPPHTPSCRTPRTHRRPRLVHLLQHHRVPHALPPPPQQPPQQQQSPPAAPPPI